MAQDYYQVLGIAKGASVNEIKAAYRKMALKWHPDKNKTPEAEKKFKEINRAYEVLSDEEKRKTYDQFGHDAFTRGGFGGARGGPAGQQYQGGPFRYTYSSSGGANPFEGFDFGGFSDPFDIFEQFFGFGGQRGPSKPIYQIQIDFFEAVKGVSKTVSIGGKSKTIKIPAEVDDGTRIRFSDFDLAVSVKPDKTFRREGQDVVVKVDIPLTTAILGGTVEVPTVEGKKVKLKVKEGTQHGSMLRLQGQGIPYPNANRKGNQYVVFDVKMPKNLSKKQKELLKEFENSGK